MAAGGKSHSSTGVRENGGLSHVAAYLCSHTLES